MGGGKERKPIWTKAFISICLISAIMNLSKQMSNSILSKYVDSLGGTATVVGLIASTFALAALLFKIISGPALDAFNRKYIIIGAMMVLGVAFAGYSLSSTVSMIAVFRFIQGAAQAFTATCLLTMASDTIPPKHFSTGVGMFALFESVSQAIGPTIGLWLVDILGYSRTFGVSAGLMFVSAFVILFYKHPFSKTKGFKISFHNIFARECVPYAALLFSFNLVFCVVSTYLVIFAGKQGVTENMGFYFTVYACTLLFSRPFIGRLTDKTGIVKVLLPALGCFVLSYWMISCSKTYWMFILSGFVSAFGLGACQPTVQALCMKCVPAERRGVASSTCYIAQDLGNLIGPMAAGYLVEQFGYASMWRIMTIPIFVAAVYVYCIRRKIKAVETMFAR